jgi:hypothetical protein
MDDEVKEVEGTDNEGNSQTTWEKREEFEDGSSNSIRVEAVDGGFIKNESRRFKKENGEWEYKDTKSIHTSNPLKEKSLVDKLADYVKNGES